jgi:hypothetical protein
MRSRASGIISGTSPSNWKTSLFPAWHRRVVIKAFLRTSRGCYSFGLAKTKKLEALILNRPFNHVARKIVWRLPAWRNGAHRMPWLELARQLRAG